jgi:hypothetical protein
LHTRRGRTDLVFLAQDAVGDVYALDTSDSAGWARYVDGMFLTSRRVNLNTLILNLEFQMDTAACSGELGESSAS